MPNATCILIAYVLVLVIEGIRWWFPNGQTFRDRLVSFLLILTASVALLTHSLYVLDRVFVTIGASRKLAIVSWHDWAIFASWAIALVYGFLLVRRGESRVGTFILPTVILLVASSLALPPVAAVDASYSVTGWRFAHSVGMMAGTVLVSIGFAMGLMYFLHSSRLKSKRRLGARIPLPSLEYLQTSGRVCLLGSAASIGFGMLAGVIMNLTKDGRVEWFDRGILFSGGLFIWLTFASLAQSILSKRGSGRATAAMNVLSFLIVAAAIGLVLSTPHGANRSGSAPVDAVPVEELQSQGSETSTWLPRAYRNYFGGLGEKSNGVPRIEAFASFHMNAAIREAMLRELRFNEPQLSEALFNERKSVVAVLRLTDRFMEGELATGKFAFIQVGMDSSVVESGAAS